MEVRLSAIERRIHELALSFPEAYEDRPWGDFPVYKVGENKVFGWAVTEDEAVNVTVKLTTDEREIAHLLPYVRTASYVGRNVSNRIDLRTMERAVSDVVVGIRVAGAGLDPAKVKDLTKELDLKTIRLSESGEREDQGAAMILAIILLMILYTAILMWGQLLMTSVIEEKTSRVVEVMASGVPSTTLLAGKLLGVGGAGLTQFLVWSLSLFGVSLAMAGPLAGTLPLPEITPLMLVSFVLFFLLGFFFYASLYAAIGSAVNTVQEAQNFVWPVMMPFIVGMVSFSAVLESPDGVLSVSLSMIPGISPLIMFLRIVVLTPPVWQIALSIALLAAAILGILMYGKKPTFPELMRWVRHT